MSHAYARKATRDDRVTNALANLLEDLCSAQHLLDISKGSEAKEEAHAAVMRFRKVADAGIRDLIIGIDLGRIRLTLDYADELGEIHATYLARKCN